MVAETYSTVGSRFQRITFSVRYSYQSHAGWGIYCATKFAVEGISEALSAELAPLGIHATVVEPGFFRTDFLDPKSLSTAGNEIADYAETAGAMRSFAEAHNHQQPNDPQKLAPAVLELVRADYTKRKTKHAKLQN